MKRMLLSTFLICGLSSLFCYSQKTDFFKKISSEPNLFGEGVISDGYGNRDMTISPDGRELMYTLQYKSGIFSTILFSRKTNDKWSIPEIVSFSGKFNDLEPAYSPDGTRIYFVSNRPTDGSNNPKDYDIWYAQKNFATGLWMEAIQVDTPVNTRLNEFYPSVGKTGSIYFTRVMEGRDEDIVVCTWNQDHFEAAQSLPGDINSTGAEFNAYVNPDEDMIFFTAYKRPGNIGLGDLYVSVKRKGLWQPAINLGDKINDKGLTYCPYLSPDKKYFFFTSNRWTPPPFPEKQNLHSLKSRLESPLNGWDNIYCVDAAGVLSLIN